MVNSTFNFHVASIIVERRRHQQQLPNNSTYDKNYGNFVSFTVMAVSNIVGYRKQKPYSSGAPLLLLTWINLVY